MSEANESHLQCLVCGSLKLKPLELYKKHYVVKCLNCGFVFCSRIPTEAQLNKYYNNYGNNYLSSITIIRYNELLNKIERYRKNNRVMDVGCGVGYFLEIAKQRKWEVFGTEYTDYAIDMCAKKGINMKMGALDSKNYEPGYFDVIISNEVIEHVGNPRAEVANFNKILRNGGLVYLTTPNFNSLSKFILGSKWNIITFPEHLSYFTSKSISRLMKLEGFNTKKINTTGFSITRIKTSMKGAEQVFYSNSDDEKIRSLFEKDSTFGFVKKGINGVLNLLGIGDTIKAFFEK